MDYPVHRRDVIRKVKYRWLTQYARYNDASPLGWDSTRTFADVRAALNALDTETCTSADVDKAIGTGRWADNNCSECGTNCDVLLHIGDEPDYEARYVELCASCLANAATILAGVEPKP